MTAAADGHMDIVKMLLQHDANVALKDSQGWKAADHAVMNGIHRCVLYMPAFTPHPTTIFLNPDFLFFLPKLHSLHLWTGWPKANNNNEDIKHNVQKHPRFFRCLKR